MTRRNTGLIAVGLCSIVIGLPIALLVLLSGDDPCLTDGVPAPSAAARADIPGDYLALYEAAGREYGLPWTLLAAVGSVETDHGRATGPGVSSGANYAGARGPMQFLAATWGAYGVDGDGDGHKDVYDPRDAIAGAANYLRASGAPADLHAATFAYNRSEAYVQQVLAKMRQYADSDPKTASAAAAPAGACEDLGGITAGTGDGRFEIAPAANLPGKPLTAAMTAFISRMATFYDGRLVVSTGTNHDRLTSSGNVSDHFSGNGADFGMAANGGTNDGPVGDAIAASAFLAAGLPRDVAIARARAGGAHTVVSNGLRIQVIWRSLVGGNHYDHVHVGIGRA